MVLMSMNVQSRFGLPLVGAVVGTMCALESEFVHAVTMRQRTKLQLPEAAGKHLRELLQRQKNGATDFAVHKSAHPSMDILRAQRAQRAEQKGLRILRPQNLLCLYFKSRVVQYKKMKKLGSGRGGAAYLAKRVSEIPGAPKEIVIKLREQDANGGSQEQEVQALEALKDFQGHTVVKYHGLVYKSRTDSETRSTFLEPVGFAMEKADCDLKAMLGKPITQKTRINWIQQILRAVFNVAQKGWVHRDLKPENILYFHRSTQRYPFGQLKLTDFDGAVELTNEKCSDPAGTLTYGSPALLSGNATCSLKTEMFSVATIWLYMLNPEIQKQCIELVGQQKTLEKKLQKVTEFQRTAVLEKIQGCQVDGRSEKIAEYGAIFQMQQQQRQPSVEHMYQENDSVDIQQCAKDLQHVFKMLQG